MNRNVGSMDRNIRIIAGIIFLLAGLFTHVSTALRIGFFAVATIECTSAIVGCWPLWKVLGISTHKEEKAESVKNPVKKTTAQKGKTDEHQEKQAGH